MNAAIKNVEVARKCWGEAAPEWVIVLAENCDGKSQASTARQLGVSGAMISQVLRNIYPGRLDKIEARVMGELMNESVGCPVLGEITKRRCVDEQRKNVAAPKNAVRIELRRACPRCPNRLAKDGA